MERWLKFGLIFFIVSLVLKIIDHAVAFILCPKDLVNIGCMLPTGILEIPLPHILRFNNPIISILITSIFYLIMGSIIGLIVGKIKSKK